MKTTKAYESFDFVGGFQSSSLGDEKDPVGLSEEFLIG